jgi:cystathionine beta-lyase/cystathionine gamma-synthase
MIHRDGVEHPATALNYDEAYPGDTLGALGPPLYQNNVFSFKNLDEAEKAFGDPYAFTYTRLRNPTVALAEEKLASLAGSGKGIRAKLFSSGMGAISAAILHTVSPGDHVVAIDHINLPIKNYFAYLKDKLNLEVSYISGRDPEEFREKARPNTSLFYLESPSSEDFRVIDIRAVTAIARDRGIKTILDNTWSTPLFQKTLEMGVDIEVHSCSKYLGGLGDLVSGLALGKEEDILALSREEYNHFGQKMAPGEAWLLLRSLRTLPIRMERHQQSALAVSDFLHGHPLVRKVLYPGAVWDEDYERGKKQMAGYSGRFAAILDIKNPEEMNKFMDSLHYFRIGLSWGSCESQIFSPGSRFPLGDLRFSIGLEDPEDLIADLSHALDAIN